MQIILANEHACVIRTQIKKQNNTSTAEAL